MALTLIGRSILGESGFSQNVQKMGYTFYPKIEKIKELVVSQGKQLLMTSMTGLKEIEATSGEYFPKIREYNPDIHCMFEPYTIYQNCVQCNDAYRPGCDFVIFNSNLNVAATTFSREAPIIAFECENGRKALGVILRPSLMKYGDYLFETMKKGLGRNQITATLVTCNHFEYPEGSIPELFKKLCERYKMICAIGEDSEKNPECYHRGENGNHVVVLW